MFLIFYENETTPTDRNPAMDRTEVENLEKLRELVSEEVGVSDWLEISQHRVNLFADATGDKQWIHVDPERAARESPFGAPVAHGYLTLSLLPKFLGESFVINGVRMGVNYGLNRVRFPSPVRVGDRIRGRFTLIRIEDVPGGVQLTFAATVEIEAQAKPACVAEMVSRRYF
jgi:acyl dehydratase